MAIAQQTLDKKPSPRPKRRPTVRKATPEEHPRLMNQARRRSGTGDDGKGGSYVYVVDENGYGVYIFSDGTIIYFSDIGEQF